MFRQTDRPKEDDKIEVLIQSREIERLDMKTGSKSEFFEILVNTIKIGRARNLHTCLTQLIKKLNL